MALDVYFEREVRRRTFNISDNGGLERLPINDVGIELFGTPEAHIFMFWMSGVADGVEVFGLPGAPPTSSGGQRPVASSRRGSPSRRVVEPFFELDHMVPAVAEVVEIVDRLGAGLVNDIGEPRLASIDRLTAKNLHRDQGYPNIRRQPKTRRDGYSCSQTPPEASDAADQGAA
ncbi:hypothetical protein ACVWZ6_002762 [Bradyrhizobium sp. GM6.1]